MVVAGKPKLGLIISIISGVTNMILDFLLIYVIKLGVAGAAIATVISQIVGAIIPIIYIGESFSQSAQKHNMIVHTCFED